MTKYVRVPVEPTEEMIEAGMSTFRYGKSKLLSEWVCELFMAMLAATPTTNPPETSSELVDDELIQEVLQNYLSMTIESEGVACNGWFDVSNAEEMSYEREVELAIRLGFYKRHPDNPNLVKE